VCVGEERAGGKTILQSIDGNLCCNHLWLCAFPLVRELWVLALFKTTTIDFNANLLVAEFQTTLFCGRFRYIKDVQFFRRRRDHINQI
jgi:hypothetical protein